MSELFDKSIRTLELPAILKMLADQANSAEARESVRGTVGKFFITRVKTCMDTDN